jgi:hypothetical protein
VNPAAPSTSFILQPVTGGLPPPAAPLPGGVTRLRVLAHVENIGDLWVEAGAWAGRPRSRLRLEGFALAVEGELAPADLAYCAVLADGTVSPWLAPGAFCGTRGQGLGLRGFCVRLVGAPAWRYACVTAATFLDGTELNATGADIATVAPSGAGLEAMRLELRPRQLATE